MLHTYGDPLSLSLLYLPTNQLALVSVQIAKELYEAGAGRLIGTDPVPFIRVLSTINHVQYDSINVKYKDQQLLQGSTYAAPRTVLHTVTHPLSYTL